MLGIFLRVIICNVVLLETCRAGRQADRQADRQTDIQGQDEDDDEEDEKRRGGEPLEQDTRTRQCKAR